MWSYYGAKTNLIDYYPSPKHDKIIEPFAGSARYALKYWDRDILLVDKYDVIIKVWKWLQLASEKDILSLPRKMVMGQKFDDMGFDCEGQRLFYSFISGCGDSRPRNMATKRKTIDRPNHINYNLQRVAKELWKIRNWKIELGSYEQLQNETATWFIDPPYEFGGHSYKESNKNIDFPSLSLWCKQRQGQIIVCENTKATWMDFKPIKMQRGSLFSTTEAIWTNEHTIYDNEQQKLIL